MADTKISDLAAVTDVLSTDEYVLARSGATKKIDASDLLSAAATSGWLFNAYAYVRDEKTANTEGGTFTSGSFQTRVLNTEVFDPDGIVTVSSNQFTLAAGTYTVRASAPAYKVDRHKAKIRNVTDSTDAGIGTSEVTANSNLVVTRSIVVCRFTISGSKAFELQHRCETTGTTTGFGLASNFGVVEVYGEVQIWREA